MRNTPFSLGKISTSNLLFQQIAVEGTTLLQKCCLGGVKLIVRLELCHELLQAPARLQAACITKVAESEARQMLHVQGERYIPSSLWALQVTHG